MAVGLYHVTFSKIQECHRFLRTFLRLIHRKILNFSSTTLEPPIVRRNRDRIFVKVETDDECDMSYDDNDFDTSISSLEDDSDDPCFSLPDVQDMQEPQSRKNHERVKGSEMKEGDDRELIKTSIVPSTSLLEKLPLKPQASNPERSAALECLKCDVKFTSMKGFRRHMKPHRDLTYKCAQCNKTIKRKVNFLRHVSIHNGELPRPFKCSMCGKHFSQKYHLNRHVRTHGKERCIRVKVRKNPPKLYTCQFCCNTFPRRLDLTKHVRKDHIDTGDVGNCQIHNCSQCDMKFLEEPVLAKHLKTLHATPTCFKCTTCDKTFACKSGLLSHMRTAHVIHVNIKCPKCDKQFVGKFEMLKHMHQIHIPRTHMCSICGKAFKTERDLNRHNLATHTDPSCWEFQCSTCERRFHAKYRLDEHIKAFHENAELRVCALCGKEFKTEERLRNHLRVFHTEPKLKCSECSKTFRRRDGLDVHIMLAHKSRDSWQFNCDKCGKKFASKRSLILHTLRHTAPSHLCTECGNVFKTESDLKRHELNHKRPSFRNFLCSVCGSAFFTSDNLRSHQRIHRK